MRVAFSSLTVRGVCEDVIDVVCYIEALLKSRSMRQATLAALLGNEDKTKLFLDEWVKFWQDQGAR